MSENAGKYPEEGDSKPTVSVTGPISAPGVPAERVSEAVSVEISENQADLRKLEPEKRTTAGLARRSRAMLSRRMYVADEIASNPLEEARDRMRALEFMARTGGLEDKDRDSRGKVVVVRVLTARGAVEVRAADGK